MYPSEAEFQGRARRDKKAFSRRGWDVSREQHRDMYIIKGETDHQPRLDA